MNEPNNIIHGLFSCINGNLTFLMGLRNKKVQNFF